MKESIKQNIKITLMLIFLVSFLFIGTRLLDTLDNVNEATRIYKQRTTLTW